MKTQQETGLSAADYASIQLGTDDLAVSLTLRRLGPVWSDHDNVSARAHNNFDAINVGGTLVRAYVVRDAATVTVEKLASEAASNQAWAAMVCAVADIDYTVPMSLATDGTAVRLFYYSTDDKIKYTEAATVGAAFGAAQDVGAVASVILLAAVSLTKVHYITEDAATYNRQLHFYEDDGGWAAISSDVYWPYPTDAMDAVSLADYDLIVLSSALPPLVGSRVFGAEVQTRVDRVQGIVTFREVNDRWSDHDLLDVLDRVESPTARADVRLSAANGYLFATYRRVGGSLYRTELDNISNPDAYDKLAVSRSLDGVNWEFPEFVVGGWSDIDIEPPAVVLPRADYLYCCAINQTARSPLCTWAGQSPPGTDVTDYITGLESTAADLRNTRISLSNPADVLAGGLADSNDRIQSVLELGYVVSGTEIKTQVAADDVVSRSRSRTGPRRGITLEARDVLDRLNRIRSDYAAEWPGTQGGRDTYDDPTGTGYGGLRHVAPYVGSWGTPGDNELHLTSSNKEGLSASTFVTTAINGSAQMAFQLHTDSEGEYAGIGWHVFDQDNLYFAAYYLDDDVVKIVKAMGDADEDGVRDDTAVHTSQAMSWVKETKYWLKVRVRYSLVYVYTSTDGITWTKITWDDAGTTPREVDGMPEFVWAGGTDLDPFSGKFGLIGYGYSDEDEWPDIGGIGEPPIFDPPVLPEPFAVIARTGSELWCTHDFGSDSPTWTKFANDISPWRIVVDQVNHYVYGVRVGGLYRADFTTLGATLAEHFAFADKPGGIDTIAHQNLAIDRYGNVGLLARETAHCTGPPVLITVDVDGGVKAHFGDKAFAPCDPWNPDFDTWVFLNYGRYALDCFGRHFTIPGYAIDTDVGAFDPLRAASRISQGTHGADDYVMYNDGNPLIDGHRHQYHHDCVYMGGGHVITRSDYSQCLNIEVGSENWTLIEPANWAVEKFGYNSLDRDAYLSVCVMGTNDFLYRSTGGQFSKFADRDDFSPKPDDFNHCSCYSHNANLLFLATDGYVFYSDDGGSTWQNKSGNLAAKNVSELRPSWTWEPGS